ncbi:DUF3311 domain-containing protein [Bhargavaea ullalensis]|uniref:DUF3311 domain-containing protein n=1 Tax=Bhargavaea ullalensis TaxID=1265685 RepID=A0ABV2GCX0_9BACL
MKKPQLLLLIPFIGMAFCLPLANKIEPYVLGLPFFMFWIVLWMVLSSLIMWIVYRLEYGRKEEKA